MAFILLTLTLPKNLWLFWDNPGTVYVGFILTLIKIRNKIRTAFYVLFICISYFVLKITL